MEFTREAWENAPEGATLEYEGLNGWKPARLIGFSTKGRPVVEEAQDDVWCCANSDLRIVLPKRKVTVQLWRGKSGIFTATTNEVEADFLRPEYWTLLGEHTFEKGPIPIWVPDSPDPFCL